MRKKLMRLNTFGDRNHSGEHFALHAPPSNLERQLLRRPPLPPSPLPMPGGVWEARQFLTAQFNILDAHFEIWTAKIGWTARLEYAVLGGLEAKPPEADDNFTF